MGLEKPLPIHTLGWHGWVGVSPAHPLSQPDHGRGDTQRPSCPAMVATLFAACPAM